MSYKVKWLIKDYLEKEERSQAWLARKSGISEEHISRLLNDKHEPREDTVEKILVVIK